MRFLLDNYIQADASLWSGAAGVAFHDVGDRGCQVGGDQGEGGFAGFDEDQDPHGPGAEHPAPQAPLVVDLDGAGAVVTGHGD